MKQTTLLTVHNKKPLQKHAVVTTLLRLTTRCLFLSHKIKGTVIKN